MKAGLCIVIVNYRTAGLVKDCLQSVAAQRGGPTDVRAIVVDNDSADGSVEAIAAGIRERQWADWVSLLPLERNGGFAAGNNAALREVEQRGWQPDYLLLLNPDTVVQRGALRKLVRFMEANPRAGIAGGRLVNAEGMIERSAHNAPTPLGELESGARLGVLSSILRRYAVSPPQRSEPHECEWVSGACMVIRRAVLENIGPLDEGFFLYFEEVDFCVRARAAGWSVWFVPESQVVHFEGSSTGIRAHRARLPAYWFASRRRYFLKHFGVGGLFAADLLWAVGRATLALRRLLRLGSGGQAQDPKRFAIDLLWGDLQAVLGGGAQARGGPRAYG